MKILIRVIYEIFMLSLEYKYDRNSFNESKEKYTKTAKVVGIIIMAIFGVAFLFSYISVFIKHPSLLWILVGFGVYFVYSKLYRKFRRNEIILVLVGMYLLTILVSGILDRSSQDISVANVHELNQSISVVELRLVDYGDNYVKHIQVENDPFDGRYYNSSEDVGPYYFQLSPNQTITLLVQTNNEKSPQRYELKMTNSTSAEITHL